MGRDATLHARTEKTWRPGGRHRTSSFGAMLVMWRLGRTKLTLSCGLHAQGGVVAEVMIALSNRGERCPGLERSYRGSVLARFLDVDIISGKTVLNRPSGIESLTTSCLPVLGSLHQNFGCPNDDSLNATTHRQGRCCWSASHPSAAGQRIPECSPLPDALTVAFAKLAMNVSDVASPMQENPPWQFHRILCGDLLQLGRWTLRRLARPASVPACHVVVPPAQQHGIQSGQRLNCGPVRHAWQVDLWRV
eukprot:364280-Chlamydomonas_euryale.AAC.10